MQARIDPHTKQAIPQPDIKPKYMTMGSWRASLRDEGKLRIKFSGSPKGK